MTFYEAVNNTFRQCAAALKAMSMPRIACRVLSKLQFGESGFESGSYLGPRQPRDMIINSPEIRFYIGLKHFFLG